MGPGTKRLLESPVEQVASVPGFNQMSGLLELLFRWSVTCGDCEGGDKGGASLITSQRFQTWKGEHRNVSVRKQVYFYCPTTEKILKSDKK